MASGVGVGVSVGVGDGVGVGVVVAVAVGVGEGSGVGVGVGRGVGVRVGEGLGMAVGGWTGVVGTGDGPGAAQAARRRSIGRRTNRRMGLPPFHTRKVGLTMVVDIVVHVVRGGKGVIRQASCVRRGEEADVLG